MPSVSRYLRKPQEDLPQLELQEVMAHPAWVLGSKLESSVSYFGFLLLQWNIPTEKQVGEERVYFILESQVSSSLGKVRAGTKVETMKAEAHRLMCSLTCSVAQAQLVFLQPRAICVRDGAALSGLGPPISVTKKMPYRLAYSPILRRHFLNCGSLFSDNPSSCQQKPN